MSSSMHQVNNNTKRFKRKGEDVKVKYISSPLMVTTCASKFRALVQELTGRHSDISHLLEGKYDNTRACDRNNSRSVYDDRSTASAEMGPLRESPTSSESLVDQHVDVYLKDGFLDLLRSDLLFDASELDVLGSYDAL